MNKQEFEQKLYRHFDILLESEQKIEVESILQKVEEKEKQGLQEEEAIKSLGSIEEIVKETLKKRGIDFSKVYKKHGFIYQKFEQLFLVIHRLVDVMSKNDFKSNLKIFIDILILFAFVALLKIPFIVVQNLGDTLFSYLAIPLISDIWSLLVDCIYIVVAVIVFINIFQKYFKNIKTEKKKTLNTKSLESISLSDQEKE